jgi:hypothetical protein
MTDEEVMEATTAVLVGKKVYYIDLACLEIEASSQEEAVNIAEAKLKSGEIEFEIVNVELKEAD